MSQLPSLWSDLTGIARRVAAARRLFVALDYDGTLTPIAATPGRARLGPRARRALRALVRLPEVHVAVLSGRRLDDLRRLLAIPRLFLAGNGGLETKAPGAAARTHVPALRRLPPALTTELRAACRRFAGAWVEDKGLVLAVHYRAVAPRRAASLRRAVMAQLAPHAAAVAVLPGKKVVEVRPRVRRDKATALDEWRAGRGRGLVVFLGDDEIDEPVHARVRRGGGVAVAVGRRRSRAGYAVGSPREVMRFLEWLAREWRAQESPAPRGASTASARSRAAASRSASARGRRGGSSPRTARGRPRRSPRSRAAPPRGS